MLLWIIQITLVSIVLIFLVHHLINFFKSTLTVPKIKDLVNTPSQKYENMYNIINSERKPDIPYTNLNNEYTIIDLLPNKDKEETNMKSELKNFLKSQLKISNNSNLGVSSLDSMSKFYSNF